MDEKKLALEKEINDRKDLLSQSDYKALKFAEGEISAADYESIKEQRQTWRDEINEYQEQLAALDVSTSE